MTLLQVLAVVNHPIWYYNAFFYLFVISSVFFFILTRKMMIGYKKKGEELKLMQQQHYARVDVIRKEHSDVQEKIRVEMLKKEEERGRQWMESEKETLHVLNGVSMLLDLNEKIGKVESEKILLKLEEIREKVEKITPKNNTTS